MAEDGDLHLAADPLLEKDPMEVVDPAHGLAVEADHDVPDLQPRLFASVPYASPTGTPAPAELLTVDEAFLELGVMP